MTSHTWKKHTPLSEVWHESFFIQTPTDSQTILCSECVFCPYLTRLSIFLGGKSPFSCRCVVSWLCTGGAVARTTDLPGRQWSGPAGWNYQSKNPPWSVDIFIFSIRPIKLLLTADLLLQVLGTPTREQIREMNPNYTEFKFPQIKAHPWTKVSQQVQEHV